MTKSHELSTPTSSLSQHSFSLPKIFVNKEVKNVKELKQEIKHAPKEKPTWAQELYGMPSTWLSTKGKDVTVAILDTGIDTDHPDLAAAIKTTNDFTGDGIEDVHGHGTHCAGIVGARLNEIGMIGVAPECDLMIGKVLNNQGSGAHEWSANGIYWAVDSGADIISMSLGGPVMSPEIYRAIQYALFYGKVVFCAAGNSGVGDGNTINYPGKNGGVITIAAHDRFGNPSGFSSRGGELDFMAPGSNIWSTYRNGSYANLNGTSMATPFAAGLAALIMSKHKQAGHHNTPIVNCEDLKNHLLRMAAHPNHHDTHSGYGALLPFKYF